MAITGDPWPEDVEPSIYSGPKVLLCGETFYQMFKDSVDPWKRELARARKQLSWIRIQCRK